MPAVHFGQGQWFRSRHGYGVVLPGDKALVIIVKNQVAMPKVVPMPFNVHVITTPPPAHITLALDCVVSVLNGARIECP